MDKDKNKQSEIIGEDKNKIIDKDEDKIVDKAENNLRAKDKNMSIDKEKVIKESVRNFLLAIGEDPDREGLVETPDRIYRMSEEIFFGSEEEAKKHLSKTFSISENNLVVERDINFFSMCEHHLLPFYGKAHIAYLPNGKVAGLSKLARCVESFSHSLQLQEKLTSQIADSVFRELDAKAVLVILEAEHMCMNMRGVKKPGTLTKTLCKRGLFEIDQNLYRECLDLMNFS